MFPSSMLLTVQPIDLRSTERSVAALTFLTRRLPMLPLRLRRSPSNPKYESKTGLSKQHYPRLIRSWYRPVIEELIAERIRQGLTQEEVNDMIGCADFLVNKWEAGLKLPSLYFMLLWCESLGMELQPAIVDDKD